MGSIADKFAEAFRDFQIAGVPASGANDPAKADIRSIGSIIETAIAGAGIGSSVSVIKTTRALLNADLAYPANTVAFVYADSTPANNDFYVKSGASGSGSWSPTSALNVVLAAIIEQNGGRYVYGNRTGASTNDALTITTESGVPVTAYRQYDLYVFNVTGPNATETPTLAINGLPAKVIRKPDGGTLAIGEYQNGTHLGLRYHGPADEFRIVFKSPQAEVPRSSFCTFVQTNGSERKFEGYLVPAPIADVYSIVFAHRVTNIHTEGGVEYLIPEIVNESRQFVTPDGSQITPGSWEAGDTILFRFRPSGRYEMIAVLSASVMSGQTASAGSMDAYYSRQNSAIYALAAFEK